MGNTIVGGIQNNGTLNAIQLNFVKQGIATDRETLRRVFLQKLREAIDSCHSIFSENLNSQPRFFDGGLDGGAINAAI